MGNPISALLICHFFSSVSEVVKLLQDYSYSLSLLSHSLFSIPSPIRLSTPYSTKINSSRVTTDPCIAKYRKSFFFFLKLRRLLLYRFHIYDNYLGNVYRQGFKFQNSIFIHTHSTSHSSLGSA